MKSFIEAYMEMKIDKKHEKFDAISNFSKFQMAKNKGQIGESWEEIVEFLKYEVETRNRPLIVKRLFDLAMGRYKRAAAEEFFNMTGTRV